MSLDLVKELSKRARERKEGSESPMGMIAGGEAKKAAVRKLMDALKNEDDERFLQAYDELKTFQEDGE